MLKIDKPIIITGTFTPVSGVTANEIQVKQVGKTVMVKGYVTKSGNFTTGSNVTIGSISGVDFPASNIRTVCGAGPYAYSATNSGYLIIGTTGEVSIQLETAKAAVNFCITYLAVP